MNIKKPFGLILSTLSTFSIRAYSTRGVLETYSKKWKLSNIEQLSGGLGSGTVFKCETSIPQKQLAALKICHNTLELEYEANALRVFKGNGCVKLLNFEPGVLLRGYAPGTPLLNTFPRSDKDSTLITAKLIEKLHHTSCQSSFNNEKLTLPSLDDFAIALKKNSVLSSSILKRSLDFYYQLSSNSSQKIVLHGDLHHSNIIRTNDIEIMSIDPKGVVGDPMYEIAAFIRNPISKIPQTNGINKIIANRIKIFSQFFNVKENDLLKWSYFGTILAADWAISDQQPYEEWLRCANIIDSQIIQLEATGDLSLFDD